MDVRTNAADQTLALPRGAAAELGREFGLGGRFRVRPSNCISYIALNTSNPLFRNNPQLRRAVNYAIDRQGMVDLGDPYALIPTDQYLPRGSPGFKDIKAYPCRPELATAKRLAAGRVPAGGPWIYYYGITAPGPQRMELVRSALREIGITIEPQGFPGFAIYDAVAKRNSPHAFATLGSCQAYPDPYDFISFLGNVAFFNDPTYNARMDRAARLRGAARLKAYESLEHDLVTKAAPWAAWGQPTKQFFFSDRVDPRSFVYHPAYETPVYNILALK
jgi:ABC-type transport system substrate-binding protein